MDPDLGSIFQENQGKSGVYRWVHLESGRSYIGSSTNLTSRFRHYFNKKYLSSEKRGESIICNALLKYGYQAFTLDILEYCSKDMAIEREQFYFDKEQPEFNILKKAGSNLGFKFSEKSKKLLSELAKVRHNREEFLLRMRGRVVSDVTKAKISGALKDREVSEGTREAKRLALLGRKLSEERVKNMAISNSFGKHLILTSEETGSTLEFPSISEVSKFLETNREQVRKYLDSNTSLKGYLISSKSTGDVISSTESTEAASVKKFIQPVVVSNHETGFRQEFPSIAAAARFLEVSDSSLWTYFQNVAKSSSNDGKEVTKKGYTITKVAIDSISNPEIVDGKLSRGKIEVTNVVTNETTVYPSMTLAAETIEVKVDRISVYLNRQRTTPFKGIYVFKKV